MPGARGEKETSFLTSFHFLVLLVVLLDQAAKWLALRFLPSFETLPLIPGVFHLTLVHNTGIAFGLFRGHESLLLALITLSLIALGIWGGRMKDSPAFSRRAFALILGGAAGNWIDRVRCGAVIDYFDFRIWPVFNLADSAITIGVILYIFLLLKGDRSKPSS